MHRVQTALGELRIEQWKLKLKHYIDQKVIDLALLEKGQLNCNQTLCIDVTTDQLELQSDTLHRCDKDLSLYC